MKALVYLDNSLKSKADHIIRRLTSLGMEVLFPKEMSCDYDIALVIGDDKTVLRAYHELRIFERPVLGVNYANSIGFLTDITFKDLGWAAERLFSEDYKLEKSELIRGLVDSEVELWAVNEICIFPSKSATLMKYGLWVNGEYIWRDMADGVIAATPIGSTAYSMSAGGPLMLIGTKAFVVTPVNSMDLTRRPLVVPSDSTVILNEIESSCDIEAIADGILRCKVHKGICLTGMGKYIKLIRLKRSSHVHDRLYKKVELAKELIKMPPSAKLVLKVLEYEGPLTQKDIARRTLLPPRTVRYALSLLLKKGLVIKTPNLRDARQSMYYVSSQLE